MSRLRSRLTYTSLAVIAIAPTSAADFRGCEQALQAAPLERSAAECFSNTGAGKTSAHEALRRLKDGERRYPKSGWLTFYRATLGSQLRAFDRVALYNSSITKFSRVSDAVGETEARLNLGYLLFASAQRDEAWLEAPKVLEAARRTKDPLLIARAVLYQAELSQRTGERLGQSARRLKEAVQQLPDGEYHWKRRMLFALGRLAYDLGRYDDAQSHYTELTALARDHDDQAGAIQAAHSSLLVRRKLMEDLPEPERLPEFTAAARDLVKLADATGQPRLRAMTHGALADLLWPVAENRDEAEKYYHSALANARKESNVPELTNALWALGRVLADTKPGEAQRLIREALVLAVDSGNATTAAYAWRQQMRLVWKMMPRERAAEESIRALGAIESLRTLQDPGIARAAVLAAWTPDYHWLIGALLDTKAPTRAEVALAFEVAERMRARLLLDSLQRVPQALKRGVTRQQLLRDISAVQYRLLDPRVQGAAREAELARLGRLEREEEDARVELEIVGEGLQAGVPRIASLELVERALGENEAMLSFSVGVGRNFYGVFAGGAWLLVSTNAGTRVIQLSDRTELHPAMSIFRGLAEGSSQSSIPASVRLYEMVLWEALAALPKTINRLIVIPDGPLHHLPFAALRPEPESPPLGSTHEIVVAPSASVWMRLRQAPRIERSAALVLADPAVRETLRTDAAAQEREWLPAMLQLGPLPYSRREGRTIVTTMGRESQLLTGRAATESALKAAGLDAFLIVHFATHALVDEGHPDRSAVLLAGEEHREDGLLQPREIADLALPGRVVVLSACRSATGAVLAGEGVLGLSRAFFEAGARTIVGTLWAIRDDHAAAFFEAFYASFGRGLSVGDAMRKARQQAITQGIPASVWSSVVVMGDDTVAAIPAMNSAHTRTVILLALVSTLAVTIVLIMVARRKARRRSW